MDSMTSRDRIVAALEGQPVDHPPFCPFLAYVWQSWPKEIQDPGQLEFHRWAGADPLWRGAVGTVVVDAKDTTTQTREADGQVFTETVCPVGRLRSVAVRSAEGNTCFLVEHPLKTEEDYKVQIWIEEHTESRYTPVYADEFLAQDGREGLALGMLIPRCKSAFQSLIEHHVGTEKLTYDLCDFPDTVTALWRAMADNDLKAVRLAADSPYDYFITWEDSSTQNYSPAQYEQFIGAEIRQWCAILRQHGKRYVQHACGHVRDLAARMKADGVHAIESVASPPTGNIALRDLRAVAGSKFGIVGGIEPTELLRRSPEKLVPYVEQVLADGAGGPFVLANADSCPPGVPPGKFKLIAQVARGFPP